MFKRMKHMMSASEHGQAGGPSFEPDSTDSGTIALLGVGLIVILVFCWFAGEELLYYSTNRIMAEDVAARDQMTNERKAQEAAAEGEYEQLDKDAGVYKIPIQKAYDMLIKRNSVEPVTGVK